ncbi:transcription initiation factor TFIID subunit 4-like [Mauremys reevesii]|uniref:transcription initiation factor TFIID subunit 4-like n=1 Tax=Mauremys reevesii TaxID=260615 RepID=UPI00193F200B|nr:transcription initiation factor TFIID subunit 4-like [Mauremys reevesii]
MVETSVVQAVWYGAHRQTPSSTTSQGSDITSSSLASLRGVFREISSGAAEGSTSRGAARAWRHEGPAAPARGRARVGRPGEPRAWRCPRARLQPQPRRDGAGEEAAAAGSSPAAVPAWDPEALPARARTQRYLSPVWEEELEPAGAAGGRKPEAPSPDLLQQARLRPGCGSPGTPLFRSFFAEECLAIARQLQRPGPEPAGIEAEPLPLPLESTWAEAPPGRGPAEPGLEQPVPRQAEEGLRGWGSPGAGTGQVLPSGAGPGAGAADPEPGARLGLALDALNLTVELQGSGPSGASLRQATFEVSAASQLGATVTLPAEGEPLADQSQADDPERSRSAYRTHELDTVSNESAVSLGSSSFATSTPLMGPAKFHFVTGSPLGDDLEQRDPNSSRRSVPRARTCPSQAASKSAAPQVAQSAVPQCGNLPEGESRDKVTLKPPQKSTALPVSSRSYTSSEGQAAIKSLPLAFTTPRASRSLALASFESRRASRELLRAGLPPRSRGIASEGKAARLSLGNCRPSMQKAAATGKTSQGSNAEIQPAAQLPASGTGKRSATKLPCSEKCPSSLQPPTKVPGLSSSSRPLLMGSGVSLGPGILCMSKGAGAPGSKLPTHPGTRLRLMKARPSSMQHINGTLQPTCTLPTGHPGARSSPQDKETESVAKPGCNKLPIRRAATTAIPARAPHSRLRPTGRATASPRRLPSPKRARLGKDTNSAAAAQAPEPSGGEGDTEDKPALAVGEDCTSAGGMAQPQTGGNSPAPLSFLPDSALESGGAVSSMQLPDQLLSQELQRVRSELQRVKNELAARDAQCEAYRRTISSLEAQLRAGSLPEGWCTKQDCALEGE